MSDYPRLYRRRDALRLGAGALLGCLVAKPLWAQTEKPRVISLFQGATDSAVALGVIPVAVVDSWIEKPMYHYLRPALQGIAHVGLETQPSLEDIVLLRPSLIVASRFRHQAIAPLLGQIAPLVMLDEVYAFKTTLNTMAEALNRTQIARQLLERWQQRVAGLQVRLARHFLSAWPVTVSVIEVREDHIRSYLPESFAGSILSELGFAWQPAAQRAGGTSLKLTNKESLPVVDADVFFVMLRSNRPIIKAAYQKLLQHPLWQAMAAPRRQQVWEVDPVAWSLSGGILAANLMLDEIEKHVITGSVA